MHLLGYSILTADAAVLFAASAWEIGWHNAIVLWGKCVSVVAIVGFTFLGLFLVTGGWS